ncbi:hypothetical protein [Nocardia spumae]|uniref:hypothetical protein n=1 Tax=Nocardia spumae TaxID=2887190 RepID=UPI001D14DB3B|nr:hypothetical protein [Nocardia spumae]
MIRTFSAALLSTATTASLLVLTLPAAEAQAKSPACDRAIDLVNAGVGMSGGTFDAETAQALHDRLSAVGDIAVGEERAVIVGYANALVDDNVTDLRPFTDELNRVCGG